MWVYLPQINRSRSSFTLCLRPVVNYLPSPAGVYLRLQLFYGRKIHRSKRTGSRNGALEVDINESISFSVAGKHMESCRLEAALMLTTQRGGGMLTQDVEYGRVVIGPFMYARGEELIHWQEMLAQPRVAVTRWHALTANAAHE